VLYGAGRDLSNGLADDQMVALHWSGAVPPNQLRLLTRHQTSGSSTTLALSLGARLDLAGLAQIDAPPADPS